MFDDQGDATITTTTGFVGLRYGSSAWQAVARAEDRAACSTALFAVPTPAGVRNIECIVLPAERHPDDRHGAGR